MALNLASLYNRPQGAIYRSPSVPNVDPNINYADFGYIPGIAQSAQNTPPTNYVKGQPYFSEVEQAAAMWFTTRVHLSPLGKV